MPDFPASRQVPVRRRPRRAAAVLGLVLALGAVPLAACSDGGGGGPGGGRDAAGPAAPATQSGLETSVTDFSEAVLRGDHDASYAALSASCREQWPRDEWEARADAIRAAVQPEGDGAEPVRVRKVRTRNVGDADAEATVELVTAGGDPTGPDPETSWARWVHDDGRWRLDDCPRFTTGTAVLSLTEPPAG